MGEKPAKRKKGNLLLVISIIFHCSCSAEVLSSSDVTVLLRFKDSLKDDSGALSSWNSSKAPCFGARNQWQGIICSKGGSIWGLKLENMRLSGSIDVSSLSEMRRLRSISLSGNAFQGSIPDFSSLKSLKGVFLSHNQFEGSIDSTKWEGLRRLRKLHLQDNRFNGGIPKSLTGLNKLVDLELQDNQFQGVVPDFSGLKGLRSFNISNNQLEGQIPPSFTSKFNESAFQGNKDLCGAPPLEPCKPGTPNLASETNPEKSSSDQYSPSSSSSSSPADEHSQSSSSSPSSSDKSVPLIALVAGVVIAMVLAILIILLLLHNRPENDHEEDPTRRGFRNSASIAHRKSQAIGTRTYKTADTLDDGGGSVRSTTDAPGIKPAKAENGKLTFVRGDNREKFDLPDLLKAAAEILGSGCFGSSYKATLTNGSAVVVKRFKQMNNVGREEFQEHMRRLGRMVHPNLLPLVAYYYRKEEKLFITDPMERGSLALLLHGKKTANLDWPTRLKIIKGVARGLLELYKELPSFVVPHGHLKSSNVLLDGAFEPMLGDYGLIPLINQESAQKHLVAYKSPEYFNNGRVTKKTDVWALGILIMETLTGKFPVAYLQQGGQEVDMTSWVRTVLEGGFDKSMGQTKNSVGEIQKLLYLGRDCCESNVEKRLDIKEAFERIDEIKERDNDDDFYSVTEGDMRSSRGTSDDFTLNIP